MKTNLLLLACFIFSFHAIAQTNEPILSEEIESAGLARLAKVELGLHGIGLAYELPFSKKWSANLSAGLGGGYYVWGNEFKSTLIINDPVAYFRSEFKYTYNRSKRLSKSKSVLNNAGNYVAFQTKYTTRRVFGSPAYYEYGGDILNRALLNEVHWGIQRPMGQKFIFNTHIGLGIAHDFDFNQSQVYPAAGVQFAYVLPNKRL
ncbi:hypothetical protein [Pontibacter pamirensis]|uniref:hypothetical protein n=1 Tax=Pontibacter pamirensis TaxID=2562824 RepID=UPI00138A2CC9|nr:hypothetical protein [Pontibacter pamirensis]